MKDERGRVAYIVAFNSDDPKSMLYRRFTTFKGLAEVLRRLWRSEERFIVVSIRMYKS